MTSKLRPPGFFRKTDLIANLPRQGPFAPDDGMGLADGTAIPTPEGWTVMGEVNAGQKVFDHRGCICTVVEVRPQGIVPGYRVRFDDRSSLVAGGRQEWITISDHDRERFRDRTQDPELWSTPALFGITTRDIGGSLIRDVGGTLKTNHSIPLCCPLRLSDMDLPIEPHLLGVWLGDGSRDAPLVHCDHNDEPHYQRIAQAAGESWRILRKKDNVLTCTMSHGGQPLFLTRLRMLGVWSNKHVPTCYLRAGTEQRLALLRGLMDSDGHVDSRGWAEFTSISHELAQGVLELALTLGQKATLHRGLATLYGRFISDKFRVFFAPTQMVVGLPRKVLKLGPALRYRSQVPLPRAAQRYIYSVTPVGHVRTTCIVVDSPSHLVLAGRSLIPTLTPQP